MRQAPLCGVYMSVTESFPLLSSTHFSVHMPAALSRARPSSFPLRRPSFACAGARAPARTAWTPARSVPARPAQARPLRPLQALVELIPGARRFHPSSAPPSFCAPPETELRPRLLSARSALASCAPAAPSSSTRARRRGAGAAGTTRRGRGRGAWDGADAVQVGRARSINLVERARPGI